MRVRRACPICVTRYCRNCFFRDQAVNRLWLEQHLPNGECRRCEAHRDAVQETPVRHTSKTTLQGHLDAYAEQLLTKPTKLREIDHDQIEAISSLIHEITDPVFDVYQLHNRVTSGFFRSYKYDGVPDAEIKATNEMIGQMLQIEKIVRQWVKDHPENPDG